MPTPQSDTSSSASDSPRLFIVADREPILDKMHELREKWLAINPYADNIFFSCKVTPEILQVIDKKDHFFFIVTEGKEADDIEDHFVDLTEMIKRRGGHARCHRKPLLCPSQEFDEAVLNGLLRIIAQEILILNSNLPG